MKQLINEGDTIAIRSCYGGDYRFCKVARTTPTQAILDDPHESKIKRDGDDGQAAIGATTHDNNRYYRNSERIQIEYRWQQVANYAMLHKLAISNGRGEFAESREVIMQVVKIHKSAMKEIADILAAAKASKS